MEPPVHREDCQQDGASLHDMTYDLYNLERGQNYPLEESSSRREATL